MSMMKRIFFVFLLVIGALCAVTVAAEDTTSAETGKPATSVMMETKSVPDLGAARADGYFQNTRSVLLLSPRGANDYIAHRMGKELTAVFRYPYYRIVTGNGAAAADTLTGAAKAGGADIVVLPIVVEFTQFRHPGSLLWDSDPIVLTAARLRLDWWETGMEAPAMIETRFFDRKPEGFDTDPDRIFDAMWKQLMKKFPYRRIPTDLPPKETKETKENREAAA